MSQHKHPDWKPSDGGATYISKLKESSKYIVQDIVHDAIQYNT